MAVYQEMEEELGATVAALRPSFRRVVECPGDLVGLGDDMAWACRGHGHRADQRRPATRSSTLRNPLISDEAV